MLGWKRDVEAGPAADGEPRLVAYRLESRPRMLLRRAASTRAWMNDTPQRFANRCLPLLIANQAGWHVVNPDPVRVVWDGTRALDGVSIERLGSRMPPIKSHFGSGIVTWNLPYLFRTPPGYNLHVRGPANWPKDGASPLEGIVETDWSPATFTMNWKLTRPHAPVTFEADEPICLLVPCRRGELERFQPAVEDIGADAAVARSYTVWVEDRQRFLLELQQPGSDAIRQGWQRHYVNGASPDGARAPQHQTKLALREFEPDSL